jgi:hypothetical protein
MGECGQLRKSAHVRQARQPVVAKVEEHQSVQAPKVGCGREGGREGGKNAGREGWREGGNIYRYVCV